MSTPLYSLEESLERSVIAALEEVATVPVVAADVSSEADLPFIAVRAEKQDELVRGMQTWNARVSITLSVAADETTDEERDARRVPDPEDTDEGAPGFKAEWKTLTDAVTASGFAEEINAADLCHVWGIEQEPINYENTERTFVRTLSFRCWLNEVLTIDE